MRHQLNNSVTQPSSNTVSSNEDKSSKLPVSPDKRRSEARESQIQQSPQRQPNSPAINRGNRNTVQDTLDSTSQVTGIAQRLLFPALNDVS